MSGPLELLGNWLENLNHEGAPVLMTDHREIHEGEAYRQDVLSSGIADGGQIMALFWNPSGTAGKHAHTNVAMKIGGLSYGYLYENPDLAVTGTVLASINYNRAKAALKPAQWKVGSGPTINNPGTLLAGRFLGGTDATNPNEAASRGEERSGFEWVLDPSNVYLLVARQDAGTTVPGHIELEWYEHEET